MRHQIISHIPAISIHYFLNSFCILFAYVTSLNVIGSCLSPFFFNSYYCYLKIIICLLVGDIIILDRFSQLIQILFDSPKSSLKASILHFLCKCTPIFYNSISIYCIKLKVLLFCAKLLFSIGKLSIYLSRALSEKNQCLSIAIVGIDYKALI